MFFENFLFQIISKDIWSDVGSTAAERANANGNSFLGKICTNRTYSVAEEIGGFANIGVVAHQLGYKYVYFKMKSKSSARKTLFTEGDFFYCF